MSCSSDPWAGPPSYDDDPEGYYAYWVDGADPEAIAASETQMVSDASHEGIAAPLLADNPEAARAYWGPLISHTSVKDLDDAIRRVEIAEKMGSEIAEKQEAPLPDHPEFGDLVPAQNLEITWINGELATAHPGPYRDALLARRELLMALGQAWCPDGSTPSDDMETPEARAFARELSRTRRPARRRSRPRIGVWPVLRARRRAHCVPGRRRPGARRPTRSAASRDGPSDEDGPAGEPPGGRGHHVDVDPRARAAVDFTARRESGRGAIVTVAA